MLQPRSVKQKQDVTLYSKQGKCFHQDTLLLQPRSVRQKQDGTLYSGKQGKCFHQDTLDFECYNQGVYDKNKMGHYIQLNKASVFIKIHWTLNPTTKECKTKTRHYIQ